MLHLVELEPEPLKNKNAREDDVVKKRGVTELPGGDGR